MRNIVIKRPKNTSVQVISGTPYVYIDKPFWNPLKKRGEHKRKYVGKLVGNLFVPNASYLLELANFDVKAITKPNKTVTKKTFSYLYGSTYLLDRIADTLGIREDLEVCFPNTFRAMLSLVYFLTMHEVVQLSDFPNWDKKYKHPGQSLITSEKVAEIVSDVNDSSRSSFLRKQATRLDENKFFAYDIYSDDAENTVNQTKSESLVFLFGKRSHLPIYYRSVEKEITPNEIAEILQNIDFLIVSDYCYDRYESLTTLIKTQEKFLVRLSQKSDSVSLKGKKKRPQDHTAEIGYLSSTEATKINEKTQKKKSKTTIFLHHYLEKNGKEKLTLSTDTIDDALEAFRIYQTRSVIEKTFAQTEENEDLRETMNFLQYLSLIFRAFIKKKLERAATNPSLTMKDLFKRLDRVKYLQSIEGTHTISGLGESERNLYVTLGIEPPV